MGAHEQRVLLVEAITDYGTACAEHAEARGSGDDGWWARQAAFQRVLDAVDAFEDATA